MVERFALYVGQLGGKTRRARTPVRRLYDAARSRNLARHFTGQRRRNLRTMGRMTGRASVPRTWRDSARTGLQFNFNFNLILPLQEATRQNIDAREHLIKKILHPTLNGVTPYCGMCHIEWLYGDLTVPEHKLIQQLAAEIRTRSTCTYTAPQLLHLLTECRPVLQANVFERVFHRAEHWLSKRWGISGPRRIPLQIPGYDSKLQHMVRSACVQSHQLP